MKKIKKSLILGCSILLTFGILNYTGCNNQPDEDPTNSSTTENTTENNKETDTDEENSTDSGTGEDTDDSKESGESGDSSSDSQDSGSSTENDSDSADSKESGDSGSTTDNSKDSGDSGSTTDNSKDSGGSGSTTDNSKDSGGSGSTTASNSTTTTIFTGSTDLGEYSNSITLESSYFSDMEAGDYITITTTASTTFTSYYQLTFKDTSNSWAAFGSDGECTNATFNSQYTVYTLDKAAQETRFTPSASEITILKGSEIAIQGTGVVVTKITKTIAASSGSTGDSGDSSENSGDSGTSGTNENSGDSGNSSSTGSTENNTSTTTLATLSDSNATENARRLYTYLKDSYGKKVITGQMENAWDNNCNMLARIYTDTEKYPALMGFDFMNYTSMGYTATNVQTERAIKFWNGQDYEGNKISDEHGIVAFMWHWRDPAAASGTTGSYTPGDGSETSSGTATTAFRIPYDTTTNSWKTSSTDYTEIIADLDTIAAELEILQDAGVPVLWRPMHEAAGNLDGNWSGASAWFWWGAGNETGVTSTDTDLCGECYIALWRLMYKYFTETKGLHNLIWVWNGQNEKFYPGSDYVDIIGDDIYEAEDDGETSRQKYNSNKTKFDTFQAWDSTKLTTLTECGNLPDITSDGALWSYFMIWNDGAWDSSINGVSTATNSSNFWSGTYFNTAEKKQEIYVTNETAITLDELPDLTEYTSGN